MFCCEAGHRIWFSVYLHLYSVYLHLYTIYRCLAWSRSQYKITCLSSPVFCLFTVVFRDVLWPEAGHSIRLSVYFHLYCVYLHLYLQLCSGVKQVTTQLCVLRLLSGMSPFWSPPVQIFHRYFFLIPYLQEKLEHTFDVFCIVDVNHFVFFNPLVLNVTCSFCVPRLDVTLGGWHDVKIELLTNSSCPQFEYHHLYR